MCGIVGFIDRKRGTNHSNDVLKSMADKISYRGPDDWGAWSSANTGVYLAHRRLAILDLSPMGHQPMKSFSERYAIVFNGEIYNHLDLRSELEKCSIVNWKGHSDTETLLQGFEVWGVENTIKKAVGMFAIALWDNKEDRLYLIRDRAGEKPLYYGKQGETFLFASELKPFKSHPDFQSEINRDAISLFLRHNYIPAPFSIYEGIYKLTPGHILQVSSDGEVVNDSSYWDIRDVIAHGRENQFEGSPDEAVVTLEKLLRKTIGRQMLADVPLGAFLSGGIDSSTVVSLMQSQSSVPVKTFSIGFNVKGYNEAEHAKAVAKHLGTDHTEMYVEASDALSIVPKIASLYDEPFADSSQIPTFLVSQLAKRHVTVSLSGDAGDEIFGGYNRYLMTHQFWKKINSVPKWMRKGVAGVIFSRSPQFWQDIFKYVPGLEKRVSRPADKLYKVGEVLGSNNINDVYRRIVSHHDDPSSLLIGSREPATILNHGCEGLNNLSDIECMMAMDFLTYLPDDILVKVDRAGMAVSLESRVPFLDHSIIEFAWSLPIDVKIRDGQAKWPLKSLLHKYVPKEIVDRPKMGFGVPISDWLRGPLRDWAEALLSEDKLMRDGYFNAKIVRELWLDHISLKKNSAYLLWNILVFQAWLDDQRK